MVLSISGSVKRVKKITDAFEAVNIFLYASMLSLPEKAAVLFM